MSDINIGSNDNSSDDRRKYKTDQPIGDDILNILDGKSTKGPSNGNQSGKKSDSASDKAAAAVEVVKNNKALQYLLVILVPFAVAFVFNFFTFGSDISLPFGSSHKEAVEDRGTASEENDESAAAEAAEALEAAKDESVLETNEDEMIEESARTEETAEAEEEYEEDTDAVEEAEEAGEEEAPEEEASESEFILEGSDSRFIERNELKGMSADECRLARNEIYARHGRKFDDDGLRSYFESKDWYEGTISPSSFKESQLNDYEIYNRDLIVDYEKDMGYR